MMNQSDMTPPAVAPVPNGTPRPLWSVMIPTFDCAQYLCQTLESVLDQGPGPDQMQIEVVDDCSTKDDPETVVRKVGKGRVAFYRKSKNEGATANFNTCIERSRGRFVHILHGDDYVLPGYYREISRLQDLAPEAALFACRNFSVDEENVITSVSGRVFDLERESHSAAAFYYSTATQFCGTIIRRSFFESSGGFLPSLVHTSDCEMWTRAIEKNGGVVSPKVLSCYRVFSTNDTGRLMRSGENLRDLLRLHEILGRRFPDFSAAKGRERIAHLARSQMRVFSANGDNEAASANREVWKKLATFEMKLRTGISFAFRLVS